MRTGGIGMRILGKVFLALLVATGLFAQYRTGFSGAAPRMTGSFGSVVFPGGTPATSGVQRSFGSVVFPGGGGPQLMIPNRIGGAGLPGRPLARGGTFSGPSSKDASSRPSASCWSCTPSTLFRRAS